MDASGVSWPVLSPGARGDKEGAKSRVVVDWPILGWGRGLEEEGRPHMAVVCGASETTPPRQTLPLSRRGN